MRRPSLSANDIEIWIIKNQFNRRNLPPFTRATLTFGLEKRYETRRGENQHTKESGSVRYRTEAEKDKEKPTRKAAKAAGMGHDTLSRIAKIEERLNLVIGLVTKYASVLYWTEAQSITKSGEILWDIPTKGFAPTAKSTSHQNLIQQDTALIVARMTWLLKCKQ